MANLIAERAMLVVFALLSAPLVGSFSAAAQYSPDDLGDVPCNALCRSWMERGAAPRRPDAARPVAAAQRAPDRSAKQRPGPIRLQPGQPDPIIDEELDLDSPVDPRPASAKPALAKPAPGKPAKPILVKPILAKPVGGKPVLAKPVLAKPAPPPRPPKQEIKLPLRSLAVQYPAAPYPAIPYPAMPAGRELVPLLPAAASVPALAPAPAPAPVPATVLPPVLAPVPAPALAPVPVAPRGTQAPPPVQAPRSVQTPKLPADAPLSVSAPTDSSMLILVAQPGIQRLSQLDTKTIGFDRALPVPVETIRTALKAAGAPSATLVGSERSDIDRLIDGKVQAIVVSMVAPGSAVELPRIGDYSILALPVPKGTDGESIKTARP